MMTLYRTVETTQLGGGCLIRVNGLLVSLRLKLSDIACERYPIKLNTIIVISLDMNWWPIDRAHTFCLESPGSNPRYN